MTRRPLIGLSGRTKRGDQVVDMPEVLHGKELDVYFADYARAVWEAGGLPVNIPMVVDPSAIVAQLDGLVLSGGADIGPSHYGAEPETDAFPPEPDRDAFELALMGAARRGGTAVLGICRGLQLINVEAGGTLHQDVPPHAGFAAAPDTEWHDVSFTPGSTLGDLYGTQRSVNSLHHQTVDQVADGYVVTARADDGAIEGLEHGELPIVSVQWHPEMMRSRAEDPIFQWLIDAATQR